MRKSTPPTIDKHYVSDMEYQRRLEEAAPEMLRLLKEVEEYLQTKRISIPNSLFTGLGKVISEVEYGLR